MQQWRPENAAMTFDEVSLERSKGFVQALQELKNLRPQLYSAAEYCEKSYLHSEQKQMVLDNLKEYAVRALVNAVDHLGTVAYKLTDLFEQQSSDVSTIELKIYCLNQKILTCQTFTDKEGLRQQQLFGTTRRHRKHYILPTELDVVGKRVESSSKLQIANNLTRAQSKPLPHASGNLAPKTLSWHLSSESNSAPSSEPHTAPRVEESKSFKVTSDSFHLLEAEEPTAPLPLKSHLQAAKGHPTTDPASCTFSVKDPVGGTKTPSGFKSFDNSGRPEICPPPARNRSILSAFFPRNKTLKPKRVMVS